MALLMFYNCLLPINARKASWSAITYASTYEELYGALYGPLFMAINSLYICYRYAIAIGGIDCHNQELVTIRCNIASNVAMAKA